MKKYGQQAKVLLSLPVKMVKALDEVAVKLRTTRSALIRQAMEAWLQKHQEEYVPPAQIRKKTPRLLEIEEFILALLEKGPMRARDMRRAALDAAISPIRMEQVRGELLKEGKLCRPIDCVREGWYLP